MSEQARTQESANPYASDEVFQSLVAARAHLYQARAGVPYHHGVRVFSDRAIDDITTAIQLRAGELSDTGRGGEA